MKIDTDWHLIDHIAAAVMILDENGVIQYVNRDSLELLGCDDEEQVLGRDFSQLISPEHQQNLNQSLHSLREDGTDLEHVYSLIHQDGSIIPVSITAKGIQDQTGTSTRTILTPR